MSYEGSEKCFKFSWEDEKIEGAPDIVLLCVVNSTQNEAIFDLTARREDKTALLGLPSTWKSGNKVHSYIGFASEKECSNSMYLGSEITSSNFIKPSRLLSSTVDPLSLSAMIIMSSSL
jgi:hypothetical protein